MPGHEVAGVEGDLLGLGEVVGRVGVQRQPPDRLHRRELLRHELGRVQQVDALERLRRRCPGRPARPAPTRGRRRPRWRRPGRDGGSPGRRPRAICASSQTREWTPAPASSGTSPGVDSPSAATSRKVWTPKPSIVRYERGMARSDITHMSMWVASVCRDTKSQKVSCADWACGISRSGCGFAGVDQVGELDAVLDEEDRDVVADQVERSLGGVELRREPADVAGGVRRAARARATVENRTNTGVSRRPRPGTRPWSARRPFRTPSKTPCAAAPRACTTRSGIRSWSKWVIFSRRWKSSSSSRPPCAGLQRVVGVGQPGALRRRQERAGLPAVVAARVGGPAGGADGGGCLLVGLATVGFGHRCLLDQGDRAPPAGHRLCVLPEPTCDPTRPPIGRVRRPDPPDWRLRCARPSMALRPDSLSSERTPVRQTRDPTPRRAAACMPTTCANPCERGCLTSPARTSTPRCRWRWPSPVSSRTRLVATPRSAGRCSAHWRPGT